MPRNLAILVLLVAVPLALVSFRTGASYSVEEPVEHLRIRWEAGDITVRATRAPRVEVRMASWGPRAFRHVERELREGILTLELRCTGPAPCGSDLVVEVPSTVAVDVDLGSGAVEMAGLAGDVFAVVGSGSIQADVLSSQEAVLQLAHGDVQARWLEPPARLVASAAEGDVSIQVPSDPPYRLVDVSDSTRTENLTLDPSSERTLRITTLGGQGVVTGYSTDLLSMNR